MGQTIYKLSSRKLSRQPVFPNRFVVEICEKVHTHYKNIRIVNSLYDWVNWAEGVRDSLDRWKKRGCPGTSKDKHIELCRKKVISEDEGDSLEINLNKNLYNVVDGIFSEGAKIDDEQYIHFKIRDVRIELSISDFKEICHAVKEAEERIESLGVGSMLQKT